MTAVEQLIFDGQSLNNTPEVGSHPTLVLGVRAGRAFGSNVGVSATTYAQRAPTAASRVDGLVGNSARTVLIDVAGQSDIYADMSAAAILAAAVAYKDARLAAGADAYWIATVPPAAGAFAFTAPEEAVRLAYNDLLRVSPEFTGVVDLAVRPELDDATDTTYFVDGLHPTAAGAAAIADEIVATVWGA